MQRDGPVLSARAARPLDAGDLLGHEQNTPDSLAHHEPDPAIKPKRQEHGSDHAGGHHHEAHERDRQRVADEAIRVQPVEMPGRERCGREGREQGRCNKLQKIFYRKRII